VETFKKEKGMGFNILMVLADQHNAGLLGFQGHPQARTPNLDRFAASGIVFENAYTQNTICTPSRVSILSGQYCHNHGYYGLTGPTRTGINNYMREFKQAGYRTAAYGKLHLPNSPRHWLEDDLDEFGDTYERADGTIGESEFFDHLDELGIRDQEDSWHNHRDYKPEVSITWDSCPSKLPYEHTQEMWCAQKAMSFMRESCDTPFCVQIALQRPHHPLLPSKQFWDLYPDDIDLPETYDAEPTERPDAFKEQAASYQNTEWEFAEQGDDWIKGAKRAWKGTLACVSQMDDVFGRLMRFLEENDLDKNTIVIYGSDHGGYHGIHGIREKAPGICSREVCRVPYIWRVPGITPQGGLSQALVENTDMAPTLMSLCGLGEMESADGTDITELLKGGQSEVHRVAVTENAWTKAIVFDNYRLVYYPNEIYGHEVGELYDRKEDPNEQTNLYFNESHREVRERGIRLLMDWLITTTRVVTAFPAAFKRGHVFPENVDDPQRYDYPECSDGKAPNWAQPKNQEIRPQPNKRFDTDEHRFPQIE
jgi:choline-sulfatase/uncharacterized sulfatase